MCWRVHTHGTWKDHSCEDLCLKFLPPKANASLGSVAWSMFHHSCSPRPPSLIYRNPCYKLEELFNKEAGRYLCRRGKSQYSRRHVQGGQCMTVSWNMTLWLKGLHKYKKACFSHVLEDNSTTPDVVAELEVFSQYRAPTLHGLPIIVFHILGLGRCALCQGIVPDVQCRELSDI